MTLDMLMEASRFDHILPNYDADNSPNWNSKDLTGQAAVTTRSFVSILRGEDPFYAEMWPRDMFKQQKGK